MNKYLRAISYNFVFFLASVLFFLVITPIAIRVMGEEFFGLWSILSALMLFSNVGTVGIAAIVMKFSSEAQLPESGEGSASRVITAGSLIVLVMALLLAFALFLGRGLIARNIDIGAGLQREFGLAIVLIGLGLFPQFLARVPHGFLLARLHNREARQLELLSSVLIWLGATALALVKKDLVLVATWCVLSNMLVLLLYMRAVRALTPLRYQFSAPLLKKMLHFSGFLFLENLAIALFQHADKIIVGITLGPVVAGVYAVGTSLALRLSMLAGQATEVMIPYASLKDSLGEQARLYQIFRQLSRYVSLVMAGMASMLIIWMQDIVSLWISPDYAARYANAFRVLVVAYGWLSLSRPAHQTLTGLGKVRFTALTYLFSTLVMLAGLFMASQRFGLVGAVTSDLLMLALLAFNLRVYRLLQPRIPWATVLSDLQWGLFLPALACLPSVFMPQSNLVYRLLATLILAIALVLAIARDDFARNKLLQMAHLATKARIS